VKNGKKVVFEKTNQFLLTLWQEIDRKVLRISNYLMYIFILTIEGNFTVIFIMIFLNWTNFCFNNTIGGISAITSIIYFSFFIGSYFYSLKILNRIYKKIKDYNILLNLLKLNKYRT